MDDLSQSLEALGEGASKEEFHRVLWERGELSWKLDTLQRHIKSQINVRMIEKILILSSRQIGKSYTSVVIGLEFCIRYPGSIVRILAPTLKQVSDIVQDNLAPICYDAPAGLINRSKSDYRWSIGQGSSLRLGALERAHVDNNRGGNADLVIYEEGGFVSSDNYKYAVESVIGPQLLRSGGGEIHISSPSEDDEHYLHTTILPLCEDRNLLFQYTVYDSPSVTPAQIEKAIERCGGVDTESFQREYMARIVRSKTLMVVPEFDASRHVREFEIPEHYKACLSIDMGGVRDKTAGYSLIWDFRRAKLLVVDELFLEPNTPTAEVVKGALDLISRVDVKGMIFADVPGQVQVDMKMSHDFQIAPPLKDDRDAGINNLRLYFQRGDIEVHPRCKNLIGSLKSGRYNDMKTDFLRSQKYGHCDAIMALMYGCRMIDTTTNPYPKPLIKHDTQLKVPYRTKEDNNLVDFARELIPWNPAQRRK